MNKADIIEEMGKKSGLEKRDCERALNAFTNVVTKELKKGGRIQLVGFGTFETVKKEAREGRNPQNGEPMQIAASISPKFKVSKALKEMLK